MLTVQRYGLVAAIFAVSLLLWIVAPLGALWTMSQVSDDAFVIVFGGIGIVLPFIMAAFGLVLARLNGAYVRTVDDGPPKPVLEVSLTVSVMVAAVSLLVFFFFFAHNANPGNPGL